MPKTHKISKETAKEIAEIRKGIKDKSTDRRLHAVQLRGEGMKDKEIADKLDTTKNMVSKWVCMYVNGGGVQALMPIPRKGTRNNLSYEQEEELLKPFIEKANKGQIVEVREIKEAYIKKVGHEIGNGQIYKVLKRHGWRKVMPRSRHPKKANAEAIEASKKLTQKSRHLSTV